MARKSLPQKLRFEVFKRDSFTCQYCGSKAPDVVLEADHIKPIAEGGDDEITNLITSCFDCNRGKGKILLSDDSVIEKQRKQLEELNERRQQLEMMLEWREGLSKLDDDQAAIINNKFKEVTGQTILGPGLKKVKKWLKKYNITMILDSIEDADIYLERDSQGNYTAFSLNKAFDYIPKICASKVRFQKEPHLKELYYIRGIMRNRYGYVNEGLALQYLKQAYEEGASTESLKEFVLSCKSWTQFTIGITDFIGDEHE